MLNSILEGCTLGFDFGTVRIGVAQGDTQLSFAHAIHTIHAEDNETRFAVIKKLIDEWQPVQLVVGLPTHMDGKEHEMTARSRRFARQLDGRFGLPVFLVDERLTSAIAEELLIEANVSAKKRKLFLDQVAAQAILTGFFENKNNPDFVFSLTS